mmetsp:Transcript_13931/g.35022  ORF Transcript_13931/g.35022 Transcript_13931/m.35022 type:complete len:409 (+) Transcript_13931:277-1503(+)
MVAFAVVARRTRGVSVILVASLLVQLLSINNHLSFASSFVTPTSLSTSTSRLNAASAKEAVDSASTSDEDSSSSSLFDEFASFLISKQSEIIGEIEQLESEYTDDGEEHKFTKDCWGVFLDDAKNVNGSGGITRVIQKGKIVEKGACSLTVIKNGKLTADRAASIRGRQEDSIDIKEGDTYCAAALSMVLHTRSPMVPTFRSDVRIFLVESEGADNEEKTTLAWFGGGSDLTPYYLFDEDISFFHGELKTLCEKYQSNDASSPEAMIDYPTMKQACDEYFYLPARSEHRGVGGMFFDDLPATPTTMKFVEDVASNWMRSWFPIINKRQSLEYTEKQREWQLLRRGRYLEFNLLYDRGVKFGLANANPRVEGVMVSAPPLIAWEYNHKIEPDSEEDRLMRILKSPIEWV